MNKSKIKTGAVFLAFLCMGFGDAAGTFVNMAKERFELSNAAANLTAFAGLIMFGVLSVPLGAAQNRMGRKNILTSGLVCAFAGIVFLGAAGLGNYAAFLLAVLLLGAGAAMTQVAGNPIMRDVSADGSYSRNLSLGQFVKAAGSMTAPAVFFLVYKFGFPSETAWYALLAIFAAFLSAGIALLFSVKIPAKDEGTKSASTIECVKFLGNGLALSSALGIFLYVGAEVCISAGMPVYFSHKFEMSASEATRCVMTFFVTIMFARLAGAAVLKFLKPEKFLLLTCATGLAGFALLFVGTRSSAEIALIVIGAGFANVFPLIFSMAIDRRPDKANELSGLMVTAITGGAFIPIIMGAAADKFGALAGFAVPCAAFFGVSALAVAFFVGKKR